MKFLPPHPRSLLLRTRTLRAAAIGLFGVFALAAAGTAIASSSPDEQRYIVVYEKGVSPSKRAVAEERRGNDVTDVFRSAVKGLVVDLSAADVARLRNTDGVELVERDKRVEVSAFGPRNATAASWGLDRADQRSLPMNNQISTAENGFGVTAYIIDTGINANHQEFTGRVSSGYDAIGDGWGANDCNGHGTHVSGTVGGSTYGIAPEVQLVPVRVLDCSGSGWTSGVISGIDWAAQNHQAGVPAVANMSLGGGYSSALNQAVENAVADGITMAVAAGNENRDACIGSPASAPSAITVGATDRYDTRASFSNFGSCTDLFAPGVGITSAWIGSPIVTNTISGTSMASPHVAGAAALALSASPSLTPAQVTAQLSNRSTTGVVRDPGVGTPNHLLYVGDPSAANPTPDPGPLPEPPPPPPPTNDNFTTAPALSLATGATGTNIGGTLEAGEPAHVSASLGPAHSVWWKWTASANGTLLLNTSGSDYDTLLAVYSGSSVGALTPLAGNDDAGSGQRWSSVSLPVTSGVTYRIAVDGWSGKTGQITLGGSFTNSPTSPPEPPTPEPPAPTAPANDDFANAQILSSLDPVTGTTVDSTHQDGEPAHVALNRGSAHSVWYRWTAPTSGNLALTTQGSDFDTLLAAYSGSSVGGLTELASNDDVVGGLWSSISFDVVRGTTYSIAVDGYAGRFGGVALSGSFAPVPDPPPDDPDPQPVEGVLTPVDGSLAMVPRGALGEFSCASPDGQTATDGCDVLVRLSTNLGSTRKSVRLALDTQREFALPMTAKMRRAVARNGLLSATLVVVTVDGRAEYPVTIVPRAASRNKRR